jgi:gluconokinase
MILIVMGVSGSGKSTIGQMLADQMGWPFFDGDDFHPPANVKKMSLGIPLTDEDRAGWLAALARLIRDTLQKEQSAVLACSALKARYREQLLVDPSQVKFIYLKGSYAQIEERMQARSGHYMKPAMLASQFAALEEPADALTVTIDQSPAQIVSQVIKELNLSPAKPV